MKLHYELPKYILALLFFLGVFVENISASTISFSEESQSVEAIKYESIFNCHNDFYHDDVHLRNELHSNNSFYQLRYSLISAQESDQNIDCNYCRQSKSKENLKFTKSIINDRKGVKESIFYCDDELVDSWKKLDDLGDNAFNQLKKDPDFLKKFDDVVKNSVLNKHVLEGDVSYEILEAGQKKWKAGGVHHKTAFDNGAARIKSGTKSTPNANGYYTAKVEVYHPEFPDNGGFKVKSKESTFFPDDWSLDKLQAEIAGAIKNKGTPKVYPDGRKLYKGTMTDGTELAIWEDAAGNITSTYPVF